MSSSRAKNSARNLVWGILNRVFVLVAQFVIKSVIVQKLGSEYLGLNNLFTSILQILNLSELGFGSAVVFSLYKPVAEKDAKKIGALMHLYKNVYRVVGLIILILGLTLLPFINNLIEGGYPNEINIYVVYLIQLANTVVTYFLFAYKNVLFIAHQRTDINTKINSAVLAVQYVVQIVVIISIRNYYAFIAVVFLATIANNLIIAHLANKYYGHYLEGGKVDKQTKKQLFKSVHGLLVNKICQTTRNALDSVFLSAFMGLNTVAIYNNYYGILNAVLGIAKIVTSSTLSSIGNSIVSESQEKNYSDMRKLNFIFMIVVGWVTVFLLNIIQPFMVVWMGEEFLFSFDIVILFCVYFYALGMGVIRGAYSDAAGLWWENRYRALAETIANVVLNFVLGRMFGVHGIIVATLISLLIINFGMGSQILFRHYFTKHSVFEYFKDHLMYASVTIVIAIATLWICSFIRFDNVFVDIISKGLVCVVVPAIIFYAVYCKTKIYKDAKSFVVKTLRSYRKR